MYVPETSIDECLQAGITDITFDQDNHSLRSRGRDIIGDAQTRLSLSIAQYALTIRFTTHILSQPSFALMQKLSTYSMSLSLI